MTKVAIWCRHKDDNIIGIGAEIPWHIKSDFQRFRRITENHNLVVGQNTYESFPNRTLPNRNIYVLSLNPDYEVSDNEHHFVINDIKFFKDFEEDIYISGGASIYKLFMSGSSKLMPEIVVDCVYNGDISVPDGAKAVDISDCITCLDNKYRQITPDFDLDNITTRIFIRKGEFVEQSVLKHLVLAINEFEKD